MALTARKFKGFWTLGGGYVEFRAWLLGRSWQGLNVFESVKLPLMGCVFLGQEQMQLFDPLAEPSLGFVR